MVLPVHSAGGMNICLLMIKELLVLRYVGWYLYVYGTMYYTVCKRVVSFKMFCAPGEACKQLSAVLDIVVEKL